MPVIDAEDGSQKPLFEQLADQRQNVEQLAETGAVDQLTIVETQQPEYRATGSESPHTGEEAT